MTKTEVIAQIKNLRYKDKLDTITAKELITLDNLYLEYDWIIESGLDEI